MSILDLYNAKSDSFPKAKEAASISIIAGDKTTNAFPDDFQDNFVVDNLQKGKINIHTNYKKNGLEYYNLDFDLHKNPPAGFGYLDPTNAFLNRYRPKMNVTVGDAGKSVTADTSGDTYYSEPGNFTSDKGGMEGRD